MAEIVYRLIADVELLEDNPRKISEEQMETLKTSLTDNRDYFECRPVILSDRTGRLVVIAGNQRIKAATALGWEEVPTVLLSGLSEEREKEIIIRDNVSNGEWDAELLTEWDAELLAEWGVDIPNSLPEMDFDSFFEEGGKTNNKKEDIIQVVIPDEYINERSTIENCIKESLNEYPNISIK